jgi:hypothetical protein
LWRGREILLDYDKQFTTKEKYEANKINWNSRFFLQPTYMYIL